MTRSFCDQQVVLENDEIKVTLNIKHQWHFDLFQKGKEYPAPDLDLVKDELSEEPQIPVVEIPIETGKSIPRVEPIGKADDSPALTLIPEPSAEVKSLVENPVEKTIEELLKDKEAIEAEIAAKSQPVQSVNGSVV